MALPPKPENTPSLSPSSRPICLREPENQKLEGYTPSPPRLLRQRRIVELRNRDKLVRNVLRLLL